MLIYRLFTKQIQKFNSGLLQRALSKWNNCGNQDFMERNSKKLLLAIGKPNQGMFLSIFLYLIVKELLSVILL